MFDNTKIIAVDDEADALDALRSSLRQLGMPCLTYNYPNEQPDTACPHTGIRLLFLDINLIGGTSPEDDASVFNAPISLMERLIAEGNGPYALIAWSSTELHGKLIERINATASLQSRLPFHTRALPKEDFLSDGDALAEEIGKNLIKKLMKSR